MIKLLSINNNILILLLLLKNMLKKIIIYYNLPIFIINFNIKSNIFIVYFN